MTRRDYELITQTLAQAINECRYEPIVGVIVTIEQFAANLAADNRNFSKLQMIDNIQAMNVNPRATDAIHALHNKYLAELPEVVEF